MAAQASKWSPLQKADCIFTWPKNCSKMTSLQKASASNMIYTYHYLSTMIGDQPHFFSIKQLVFFSFIRDPRPLKTQRKSKRGSTWRLLSKHKMPAKCWRGFLPTKIDHEFSWPHEPQNSFPTKVHWDFNMSKKVSATCPYKSQLMLSSSL